MNAAELARKLGVARQRITANRNKPNAPALDDVNGWRKFLDETSRNGAVVEPKLAAQIAAQNLRIKKAQAEKSELENKVRRGEVVDAADIRKVASGALSFLFGEHDRLRQTLPALLKGRSEVEIYAEYDRELKKIEDGLRNRLKRFADEGI